MRMDTLFHTPNLSQPTTAPSPRIPRQAIIGLLLIIALVAFETFNFDTTEFALENLLGDVRFVGIQWATILAIAFCAIDFAGLARIFTPEKGVDEPREIWFLTGAWLLGATLNALMTWWAVSLTLLNHDLGNEVLSRQQLLRAAPIFVAVLVWLTRILFIGALSVAGEHIFQFGRKPITVTTNDDIHETVTANQREAATLSPNHGPSYRDRQGGRMQRRPVSNEPLTEVTPVPRPERQPFVPTRSHEPQPAMSMQARDRQGTIIEH